MPADRPCIQRMSSTMLVYRREHSMWSQRLEVKLVKQTASTCDVAIGTVGQIAATRVSGKGGLDYLVKFVGHATKRSVHETDVQRSIAHGK